MNNGRVLLGLVLVAIGAIALLDTASVVDSGEVIGTWWPLGIVAAGILALIGRPPAKVGGGIVLLLGLAALAVTTGVFGDLSWGVVGGVGLIAFGGWIAIGMRKRPQAVAGDTVDVVCVFSGRELASDARPFRGGSLISIFGGTELDLTWAELEDGAVLDAVGIFGGTEITVPPGWRVQMNGPALFGGFENAAGRQVLPPDAPTLIVRVLALFGAVEVKLGAAGVPRTIDVGQSTEVSS